MARKPKYETPAEMEKVIDAYFDTCDAGKDRDIVIYKKGKAVGTETIRESIPYSMEGIILVLGFCDYSSLSKYATKDPTPENEEEQEHVSFGQVVSRARTRIARDLIEGGLQNRYNSKIVTLILSSKHDYQQKLHISEGATILIGVQGPSKPTGDGEKPALEQPAKAIAIID